MVNAVVLAGGEDKTTLASVAKWTLSQIPYFIAYQKIKIPGSYKCFMKVGGEIDGVYKRRPTIEYILHALDKSELVDKVAIVTNKKKLEERLDVNIKNYMGKCIVVQQSGSMKDLKEDVMRGYNSLCEKGHTLFVVGDSPQTTIENIREFMEKCKPYMESHDFLYPIIGKRVHYKYDKVFRRKYLWIADDVTGNQDNDPFIRNGKRGFRIMSMALANPEKIQNKDTIDFLYKIRNIAAPNNILSAYDTFNEEINKILREIILRKKDNPLKLSDIEKKISSLFETRFKFIELDDASPSFDLDDVGDDTRIERANGYQKLFLSEQRKT